MGWRGGAVGCLKRRNGRIGIIEYLRPCELREWLFTMSSTVLGKAGLSGRRSGNGHIIQSCAALQGGDDGSRHLPGQVERLQSE